MHCFNESEAHAKRLLTEFPNVWIGFTGAITFNNSGDVS
jgi:Tat protein secretion system quality control protein TatD with DNase activity